MLRLEKDNNNECLQYFAVSTPNALLIKAEDGNIVGMIDYEVHEDSVKIFYITISEEYKTITPGLNLVLGNPYQIINERVIINE